MKDQDALPITIALYASETAVNLIDSTPIYFKSNNGVTRCIYIRVLDLTYEQDPLQKAQELEDAALETLLNTWECYGT